MAESVSRPSAFPASGRLSPGVFPFYTTGEDNIRLLSYNGAAGVQLKVNARSLNSRGEAIADSWDHTPNTDRSVKASDFALSGTALLNITVFATAGTPQIGQTFVILQLVRGVGAAAIVLGTILQGYVTATQAIGFPGSPIQSSLDSGGYYRQVTGATPAAGNNIAEFCPTGARWQLTGLEFQFTANANPGVRSLYVSWTMTGASVGRSAAVVTVNPGNGGTFDYVVGMPLTAPIAAGLNISGLPPDLIILAGGFFSVTIAGGAAGDQLSAPSYTLREWLEP